MMKQLLSFFILLVTCVNTLTAQQTLSDYKFVLVPQQFEFQKGKNQHQINTLTRYLFKQAGFNAIYDEELKELPRCDGLYADVISNSSFLFTKMQVVLKDCNNTLVYQSEEGKSKEKEYKKSYHEAIREAFKSLEVLGVNQGDLEAFRNQVEKRDAPYVSEPNIEVKPEPQVQILEASKSMQAYQFKNQLFYLEEKGRQIKMYKSPNNDQNLTRFGVLVETSKPGIYLFTSENKSYLANFDAQGNLLIDGEDSQGNAIQNKYQKVNEN